MSFTFRARFLWVADDHAIYAYGQGDDPSFFAIDHCQWEDLDRPQELIVGVGVPAELNGH